jgi:hypothetical protein
VGRRSATRAVPLSRVSTRNGVMGKTLVRSGTAIIPPSLSRTADPRGELRPVLLDGLGKRACGEQLGQRGVTDDPPDTAATSGSLGCGGVSRSCC